MIKSLKLKRTVSFTDEMVESTPKRPRNVFRRRRSNGGQLERQPSLSSIGSIPDDVFNSSITSTSSQTKKKRRLSFSEKLNKTTKKLMGQLEAKKKDQHPSRVFSTQLILAKNQKVLDDLVIWEENFNQ